MLTLFISQLLCLFLFCHTTHAQSSKELWQELEVAMSGESLEAQEFQAFQSEIEKNKSISTDDFIEQSISNAMAGIQKKQTPKKKPAPFRKRGSGFEIEAPARANQTIFSKKTFKAPRQRSR